MEEDDSTFPTISLPNFSNKKKLLVIGLGGGCDIISAHVFSKIITKSDDAVVIIGDCKESSTNLDPLDGFNYVFPLPPTTKYKDVPKILQYYALAMTIPKDEYGSPWLFCLRPGEEHLLANEIKELQFDCIIGIDAGGDSLVDEAQSGKDGRDKRMLSLLKGTGIDLLHIILGFGSDGESTEEAILKALQITTAEGSFKGCFDLQPMVPLYHDHCDGWLSNRRTPIIICNAIEGKKLNRRANNRVVVGRGINPVIPLEMLQKGFVFDYTGVWTWPKMESDSEDDF